LVCPCKHPSVIKSKKFLLLTIEINKIHKFNIPRLNYGYFPKKQKVTFIEIFYHVFTHVECIFKLTIKWFKSLTCYIKMSLVSKITIMKLIDNFNLHIFEIGINTPPNVCSFTSKKTQFCDLFYATKSVVCNYFGLIIVANNTFSCIKQVIKWGPSTNDCNLLCFLVFNTEEVTFY
jgi:hypothetical protein